MLDDDFFDGVDFNDQPENPEELILKSKKDNLEFWRLLKDDPSKIKKVTFAGVLQGGGASLLNGASIYVGAKDESNGHWRLSKQEGHDWTKVYLLNYRSGEVTLVPRETYEPNHEYFITVQLSGCRFTITDQFALHIAANAGGAGEFSFGGRDAAEHEALGKTVPQRRRRVSITERPGTTNYQNTRGQALAAVARSIILTTWPVPLEAQELANTVAAAIISDTADSRAIKKAAEKLAALATEKGQADRAVELSETLKTRLEMALLAVSTKDTGAYIFGIKKADTWHYHALIAGAWHDVNPVAL